MRRAVVADQPRAIHAERDVELLEADVVDDLVEPALEERRVDRRHRLHSLEREPGREQHGVLLGDPDVVVLVGHLLGQHRQAGAARHRGGDADHARVAARLLDERAAEHLRVLRGARGCLRRGLLRGRDATVLDRLRLCGVPLLHALEAALLGRRETLALHGLDVDHHRAGSASSAWFRARRSAFTSWPSITPM